MTEWITAIASIASFVVALAAVFAAWQANETSKRLLDIEEERSSRAQANLVSAWQVSSTVDKNEWGCLVSNHSRYPIWDVRITWGTWENGRTWSPLVCAILPPGVYYYRYSEKGEKSPWCHPLLVDSRQDPFSPVTRNENRVPEMEFTDANGQRWRIDRKGTLRRV